MGGNDVVLRPSIATMFNMFILNKYAGCAMHCEILHMTNILSFPTRCNNVEAIKKGPRSAWGMSYFVRLFKDDVRAYIKKIIAKIKPKVVAVCMIYFPAGVNVL